MRHAPDPPLGARGRESRANVRTHQRRGALSGIRAGVRGGRGAGARRGFAACAAHGGQRRVAHHLRHPQPPAGAACHRHGTGRRAAAQPVGQVATDASGSRRCDGLSRRPRSRRSRCKAGCWGWRWGRRSSAWPVRWWMRSWRARARAPSPAVVSLRLAALGFGAASPSRRSTFSSLNHTGQASRAST